MHVCVRVCVYVYVCVCVCLCTHTYIYTYVQGLLGRDEANQGHKRVFFYFRDDSEFLPKVGEDMRWVFDFEHITEEEARQRELSDQVKLQYSISSEAVGSRRDYDEVNRSIHERAREPAGPTVVRSYTPSSAVTRVTGRMGSGKRFGVGHVQGLQALEQQLFLDLFGALDAQHPKPHRQLNAYVLEDLHHQDHIKSSKFCFGRNLVLDALMQRVDASPTSDIRCPVPVVGLPGCGKTTVMAEFIKRLQRRDGTDLLLFFHVVASSPQSFSVKNMLTRLCMFLKKRCGLSLEIPASMPALRDSWMHFVLMAAVKHKVIIVLDAINQLSNENEALSLSWLPSALPRDSGIKIFCSMIQDDPLHKLLLSRQPVATAEWQVVVERMQRVDQEMLVGAFLGQYHKSLSKEQMDTLLQKVGKWLVCTYTNVHAHANALTPTPTPTPTPRLHPHPQPYQHPCSRSCNSVARTGGRRLAALSHHILLPAGRVWHI